MKNITLLLTLIFLQYSYSQKIGDNYQFIVDYNDNISKKQFKKGHRVVVTDSSDGIIFFKYLEFSKSESSFELNNKYYLEESIQVEDSKKEINLSTKKAHFFKMNTDDFNKFTTKYYPRFKGVIAGVFTVPFKIRLNDFDFEQNVNIGMNLGFPFRINRLKDDKWLLTPTLGIGLSTVNLNPENSDLISGSESENRTASALTLSTGLMIQFSSTINLGFQLGFDYLSNNDKDVRWKYDRKPWLGIGLNIGISVSETKSTRQKQK